MSVSFTGIKNVGAMMVASPLTSEQMVIMSLQVTNDEKGKDLDEFKKVLAKTKNSDNYKTNYDEGLISINLATQASEDEFVPDKNTFYLNATPVEVNDDNLPIFTYLAKLTRNISNKKDKDFDIDSNHFLTKDFIYGTSLGYFLRKTFESNPNVPLKPMIIKMHDPESAKNGANIINDAIQSTMVDYIG